MHSGACLSRTTRCHRLEVRLRKTGRELIFSYTRAHNRIESKQDRIAFLCTITVIELLERTKRHCGLAKPRSRDYEKSARPKPGPTSLSTFMSTLDRYVAGDISKPLLIFCPALLFLYANFTAI